MKEEQVKGWEMGREDCGGNDNPDYRHTGMWRWREGIGGGRQEILSTKPPDSEDSVECHVPQSY